MKKLRTMRDVFIEGIYKKMHEDERLFFLSADFGAPSLDSLRTDFPHRFINVGIAEQNLINLSAGIALEGFIVYAYALSPFLTMRAYEQIRNNLSLLSHMKVVNVNLIGVGAGLSYDVSGPTHHCLEDISIIRTLPNIDFYSPSDCKITERLVEHSIWVNKPKYIRLDGKPVPDIYSSTDNINLRKGFYELANGETICLVSTGNMSHAAKKALSLLAREGLNIGLIDIFTIKPFDHSLFYEVVKKNKYRCIVTVEEGFINKGGLDSLIAGIIENNDPTIMIKRMGFGDEYVFSIGNRECLHRLNGLDGKGIAENVRVMLREMQ